MQVLATVQGKAVWIYDDEWKMLAYVFKHPGARVASVLPSDNLVLERKLQALVDRGWVFFRDDTPYRPLAGPNVYLTKEGETAVKTATTWINETIGGKKKGHHGAPKLTDAQRKALGSYERNEHVHANIHRALVKLGMVSLQGYSFKLTDAGRAALRGES